MQAIFDVVPQQHAFEGPLDHGRISSLNFLQILAAVLLITYRDLLLSDE